MRTILALVLALIAALLLAMPSSAAVVNDDLETATVISETPFWETFDTTTATTSALEQSLCGQLFYGVWYKYPAPPVDTLLTYVLYNVVEGEGNLTDPVVAYMLSDGSGGCGPVTKDTNHSIEVLAGMDAYIVIGNASSGRPGLLQLGLWADPINHFGLTINGNGYVGKSGVMTVSGTVSCDTTGQAYISVYVRQKTGHGYIYGETTFQVADCVAPSSPWSLTVSPTAGGRFVAGSAIVSAEIICPYGAACAGSYAERTVKLKLVR